MQKERRGGGSLFVTLSKRIFIVPSQVLYSSLLQQGAFATPTPQTELLVFIIQKTMNKHLLCITIPPFSLRYSFCSLNLCNAWLLRTNVSSIPLLVHIGSYLACMSIRCAASKRPFTTAINFLKIHGPKVSAIINNNKGPVIVDNKVVSQGE